MRLSTHRFLVIGLARVGRTEAIEDYLKDRTDILAVIALGSVYATSNDSRCTLYQGGAITEEFPLFTFRMRSVNRWVFPLITLTFIFYPIAVVYALLRLKKRFDVAVTVSTASTGIACALLKPFGIVKRIIFYCIDYYPPGTNHLGDFLGFQKIFHFLYRRIERILVERSDMTWEISPQIKPAREAFNPKSISSYRRAIVPLGFSEPYYRLCQMHNRKIADRNRWDLGFIGVLTQWQGLAMVVDAMPELLNRFPEIRVQIVGDGAFGPELKRMVKQRKLQDQFAFHGFIRDEQAVFRILSRCVAGLAPWTGSRTDYSRYADPGKPKLYALLGLPIIMTSAPHISRMISKLGAGEAIDYDVSQFIASVEKVVGSDAVLENYISNVEKFKTLCRAKDIFDQAFETTFARWN